MLDINNPVQWQVIDETYPTLKPWFTHRMLDEMKKWKLADKVVLEYGGGWSTIFWAFHCKEVYTIETNEQWIYDILDYAAKAGVAHRIHIIHRSVNEGDQAKVDYYTDLPVGCNPDIVVDDGVLRHEVLLKALTLPRPLVIIHDNWQQDGFVCPASEELMKPFEIHNFIQEDHTDNNGRKWATAYWEIPA